MLRAVANARKSLCGGVTTIRDLGSSNRIAADVRDAIVEGRIRGPKMRVAGAVLCMTGGHGWPIGRAIDSPYDARKAVREQLWAGADCIKFIATGGVLTKGAVPGNAQLQPDELEAAIEEAHRHGLHCAAHAIGAEGIKNALRAGIDSVDTARWSTMKPSSSSKTQRISRADALRADVHSRAHRKWRTAGLGR